MTQRSYVAGLDSLRGIAAIWVVLSHGAGPPFNSIANNEGLEVLRLLGALQALLFNGPAAVAMFFAISGFCIHFPHRDACRVDAIPFYVRRLVRVAGPFAAAALLTHMLGEIYFDAAAGVFWSIYCELWYYAMYPVLIIVLRRFGWRPLFIVSVIFASAIVAWSPRRLVWEYGPLMTWVVCLPAWLAGAWVGDQPLNERRALAPWAWRAGFCCACLAKTMLRFHSPIVVGDCITVPLIGVFSALWMRQEIAYFTKETTNWTIEKIGVISYSLYLTHNVVIQYFAARIQKESFYWLEQLVFICLTAAVFYACFERPFHLLARRLARIGDKQKYRLHGSGTT